MPQLGGEASFRDQPTRANLLALIDKDTPREEPDRALDGGHVLVGDEESDPLGLKKRLDHADKHQIVGAQKLDQMPTSKKAALAAPIACLYGRAKASGKEKRRWESSFRSKRKPPIA